MGRMRHGLFGALLVLAGLPGRATAEISAEAVWTGDAVVCFDTMRRDDPLPWLKCLRQQGASIRALQFTLRAQASPDFGDWAVLTGFHEHGAVDVGEVFLPFLANTNDQVVFLNSDRAVSSPGALLGDATPADAGSMLVRRRFRDPFPSGRYGIASHRLLADGRQRFVVTDILTDGCRACDIAGTQVSFVEFAGGRFVGSYLIGWALPSPAEMVYHSQNMILSGNVRELQLQLNLAGYLAGPMDGAFGRQTAAAVAEFRRDICSPLSGPLSYAELRQLGTAERAGSAPGCSGAAPPPMPSGARTRFSRSQIEAAAVNTLLGDPYGRTPAEVRAHIVGIVFGWSEMCREQGWIVTVNVPPGRHHGGIDGSLVISDADGRPSCVGLPFLD